MAEFWFPANKMRALLAKPSPHAPTVAAGLNHQLAEKLLAALPVGRAQSVVELGLIVNAKPSSVNGTLRRLERLDKVTYLGRGFWERVRE